MSPRLVLLAADMIGVAPGRSCNDYDLPADPSDEDVRTLCDLANRANFGDRKVGPEDLDDIETPAEMRRHTSDFVVMAALREGLRQMAGRAPW